MSGIDLIGQNAAWREWTTAVASERMHHAWMLAGAKGLGKGAFARAAAAELVRHPGEPSSYPAEHLDIHVLTHLPANDDEAKKQADGKPFQTKRNITVDQVRGMIRKLVTKPTMGVRRAIVIDPADDLESGAVNALLKVLEEPPIGTFFLLVTHQPGRLLPTVRSRCRMLRFAPLSPSDLDAVIRRDFPQADTKARETAIAAAQGSPGLALKLVEHDLAEIYLAMQNILDQGDIDFRLRGKLADAMGVRPARGRQLAVIELARSVIAAKLGGAPPNQQAAIIEAHTGLARLSSQAPTFNFDAGLLIIEIGGLLAAAAMPRDAARPT